MDSSILNNILGLLTVGVLFYFVIRNVRKGGCCNNAQDRYNQQGKYNRPESEQNEKDRLTNMEMGQLNRINIYPE